MQALEETSIGGSTTELHKNRNGFHSNPYHHYRSPSDDSTFKLLLGAVCILACCSIVSIVLAAVALSNSKTTPNINIGTGFPVSGNQDTSSEYANQDTSSEYANQDTSSEYGNQDTHSTGQDTHSGYGNQDTHTTNEDTHTGYENQDTHTSNEDTHTGYPNQDTHTTNEDTHTGYANQDTHTGYQDTHNGYSPNTNAGYMPNTMVLGGQRMLRPLNLQGNPIFTIALGHDYGAHEYLDEEGYLTGFNKDVVRAVCEAAGIDCRTVWDDTTNCWDSSVGHHSMTGRGLMDGWYDACINWVKTVSRSESLAFGLPYLTEEISHFYVKKGNAFNPSDITGKKIGFRDGYSSDEKCLARQSDITGSSLPMDKIFHFYPADTAGAVAALLNGTIDAFVDESQAIQKYIDDGTVEEMGAFKCDLSGSSLMSRKDNDIIMYWNDGLEKLKNNGEYKKLCEQGKADHAERGTINCDI